VEVILATLNEERLRIAHGAAEAARSHILLLLPRLRIAHEQRKACAKQLKYLLDEYVEDKDPCVFPDDAASIQRAGPPHVPVRIAARLRSVSQPIQGEVSDVLA
jgi:hypothetical protein